MRRAFAFFIGALVLVVPLGINSVHAQEVSCNTPAEKAACTAQYNELQAEIAAQRVGLVIGAEQAALAQDR